MVKIKVNEEERDITLGTLTRGIEKGFNQRIMGNDTEVDANGNAKINPANILDAQDWKISQLTGLTMDEIDALTKSEYSKLEKEVEKLDSMP